MSPPTPRVGGGERVRTDDLLLAKQVLSQLSYAPEKMVGLGRLELPTSRLSGVRSNQAELQAHNLGKELALRAFGTRTWKGYAGGDARHL